MIWRIVMKKMLLAALLLGTAAAPAMANLALAQKNNCLSCHAVDHKVVGPAYKDVAKKYAGDKGAEAKLIAKVKAGGSVCGARSRCRQMPRSATLTSRPW
jgi:cytochrome c